MGGAPKKKSIGNQKGIIISFNPQNNYDLFAFCFRRGALQFAYLLPLRKPISYLRETLGAYLSQTTSTCHVFFILPLQASPLPPRAYPETEPKANKSDFSINPYSKSSFSVASKGTPLPVPSQHNFKPCAREHNFSTPRGHCNAREPTPSQQGSFLGCGSACACEHAGARAPARAPARVHARRARARPVRARSSFWARQCQAPPKAPASNVGRGL